MDVLIGFVRGDKIFARLPSKPERAMEYVGIPLIQLDGEPSVEEMEFRCLRGGNLQIRLKDSNETIIPAFRIDVHNIQRDSHREVSTSSGMVVISEFEEWAEEFLLFFSRIVASPETSAPLPEEFDNLLDDELRRLSERRMTFPGIVDPGMAGQGASERNTEFWFSTIDEAEDNARTRSIIYQTAYVVVVQTADPSSKPYGSMTVAVAKSAVPKVDHYFATFNNGQRFSE